MSKFKSKNNTFALGVSPLTVSKNIAFNKYFKYCAPIAAVIPLLHSAPSYAQTPPQTKQISPTTVPTPEETLSEGKQFKECPLEKFPNVKVCGEALLGTSIYSGAIPAINRADSQVIVDSRLRLKIVTKFSDNNVLTVQFENPSSPPLNSKLTGTNMTRSGYEGFNNNPIIGWVQWKVKCGEKTTCIFEPTGSSYSDNVDTFNPLLSSSSTGSMSRFGRYAPIFRLSKDGGGFTIQHKFTKEFSVTASHTVGRLIAMNANDPFAPFNGANSSLMQLKYEPSKEFKIGLTVGRSDHPTGIGNSGGTGSETANNPFPGKPTTALHYDLGASWKISEDVSLSGSLGMTNVQTTDEKKNDQSTNAALRLAANNFGSPGNTLGVIIGMPPKSSRDKDTSLHLEVDYKWKVSENFNVTPGVLVITNPEHNASNATIVMGMVRTSWTF